MTWADKKLLLAARKQARGSGHSGASLKLAWVIVSGAYGFEECKKLGLWCLIRNKGEVWLDRWGHAHYHEDTFTSELAARNELEKRLYARSERLRVHRQSMSRLLVNCAEPMPQGGTK